MLEEQSLHGEGWVPRESRISRVMDYRSCGQANGQVITCSLPRDGIQD